MPKGIDFSSYECDCGMVMTLEKKGLIHRTAGEAPSIKVLVPAEELPGLT